ncbi:hypothetical protein [Streptomyces sp. NPDC004270]
MSGTGDLGRRPEVRRAPGRWFRGHEDHRPRPLAFGDTLDVVLLDGEVTVFSSAGVPGPAAEALRAKTGRDPRGDSPSYAWFRIRLRAVEAWHEEHELRGRHLMRDGVWAV